MEFGCSSFTWETLDGKHLLGRTYDQFGDLRGNRIASLPAGFPVQTRVDGAVRRASRYRVLGMAVLGPDTPILVDGLNERGLMGALLNFPGAGDGPSRGTGGLAVHPAFVSALLLGECATVEEVCRTAPNLRLTGEPIFGASMSVHFLFSDPTGEAVILEPDGDALRVHRDTIGVMANSPDYPWQRTNLRNYIPAGNLIAAPRTISGSSFAGFGECTGPFFGLPGDYSSPARFVRLSFVKHYAVKGRDELDGVGRMFHAFAPVDIPEGLLRAAGEEERYEQSLCTSVLCAESRTYYFTTPTNRRIRALCLDRETACEPRYYGLEERQDVQFLN